MDDPILILNAGSSSVKFSVFARGDPPRAVLHGQIERLASEPAFRVSDASGRKVGEHNWGQGATLTHAAAVDYLLTSGLRDFMGGRRIAAAGHRVVHGGLKYTGPVRISPEVLAELEGLVPLAPLHQPHSIAAIAVVDRLSPGVPQVACFDTSFHRTQPHLAQVFAIPRKLTEEGVRRYGFHGLSYEFVASALREVDAAAAVGRTIVAHLGNGASMCALKGGKSVATTMGLTPLDGLVMGSRCGAIDPGVLLYMLRHGSASVDELERTLYERSGLLGVSGTSGDMRTLLASDSPTAKEAVELFVYRAAREIGSLAAAIGGLDALVFTGGIGENAAPIRAAICEASRWLGVEVDGPANTTHATRISSPGSRVAVLIVPTNEELVIARHTLAVLAAH